MGAEAFHEDRESRADASTNYLESQAETPTDQKSGPVVSRRLQLIGQLLVAEVTGVLLSRDEYEGLSPRSNLQIAILLTTRTLIS